MSIRLPIVRNYDEDREKNCKKRVNIPSTNHPLEYLEPATVRDKKTATTVHAIDPLSDPLSDAVLPNNDELLNDPGNISSISEVVETSTNSDVTWQALKQKLLKEYGVNGSITFKSSSIEEVDCRCYV